MDWKRQLQYLQPESYPCVRAGQHARLLKLHRPESVLVQSEHRKLPEAAGAPAKLQLPEHLNNGVGVLERHRRSGEQLGARGPAVLQSVSERVAADFVLRSVPVSNERKRRIRNCLLRWAVLRRTRHRSGRLSGNHQRYDDWDLVLQCTKKVHELALIELSQPSTRAPGFRGLARLWRGDVAPPFRPPLAKGGWLRCGNPVSGFGKVEPAFSQFPHPVAKNRDKGGATRFGSLEAGQPFRSFRNPHQRGNH